MWVGIKMSGIKIIASKVKISENIFFKKLKTTPSKHIKNSQLLSSLYVGLQAPLHAMRCYAYHLPVYHPELRKTKIKFLMDDDHDKDSNCKKHVTHHELFRDLFAMMGSRFAAEKELDGRFFTNPKLMQVSFDTQAVIAGIKKNYSDSIGGFCLFEEISHEWVKALHDGLAEHFPEVSQHPYFKECLAIETLHGDSANTLADQMIELQLKSANPFMETSVGETSLSIAMHAEHMARIMDTWMDALGYRFDLYDGKTIEAYDDLIAINWEGAREAKRDTYFGAEMQNNRKQPAIELELIHTEKNEPSDADNRETQYEQDRYISGELAKIVKSCTRPASEQVFPYGKKGKK